MLKRSLDTENKENDQTSSSNEMIQAKKVKPNETDDDEDKGPWTIANFLVNNNGRVHPKHKQYFIYENTTPSMVSQTARFWSRKYLKIVPHVNPDAYNMYIHNDFQCYGQLEILENCLLDIAKCLSIKRKSSISFKHLITTFRRIEALTILLDVINDFPMMDDGERFVRFIRVVGSCYVTVLRNLLPKSMFTNEQLTDNEQKQLKQIAHYLPNFHEILERTLILGQQYLSIGDEFSGYTNILHTIYYNWMFYIENIRINFNDKTDDLSQALKHASNIPIDIADENFDFFDDFEDYSIDYPDLGGDTHDIRKWSKGKRDLYSLDKQDENSDDDFWLQL